VAAFCSNNNFYYFLAQKQQNQKKAMPHSRSENAKARRREKKRKRTGKLVVALPKTKTDRERYVPPSKEKYITFNFICREPQGGVLVHLMKEAFCERLLKNLETSTSNLVQQFPPKKDETCRGSQSCYYFGHWRESSRHVTMSKDTLHPASQTWISQNAELFATLAALWKEKYPDLHAQYQTVDARYRLFGIWSLAVLNVDSLSGFHKDLKDYRNGLCTVITFGDRDFVGGELHFPEINVTLDIKPMDVAMFQSHLLTHGNKRDLVGTRHSLVLVTHNNLFNIK